MNPDELRDRLAGIDPTRDMATDPPTTPSSRNRLERIMRTDTISDQTTTPTTSRNRWIAAAAVAAAALTIGGFAVAGSGDSGPQSAGPPLELDLGESNSMMSCIMLSADVLADMPVAFAGTATSVEGDTVTLDVEQWYAGGDGEQTVVLHAPSPGTPALIEGFAFEQGTEYLVSATDGTVNFCGYSGPATPELQAVYDEAFPS